MTKKKENVTSTSKTRRSSKLTSLLDRPIHRKCRELFVQNALKALRNAACPPGHGDVALRTLRYIDLNGTAHRIASIGGGRVQTLCGRRRTPGNIVLDASLKGRRRRQTAFCSACNRAWSTEAPA